MEQVLQKTVAEDGQEALELVKTRSESGDGLPYDLIFMDIQMVRLSMPALCGEEWSLTVLHNSLTWMASKAHDTSGLLVLNSLFVPCKHIHRHSSPPACSITDPVYQDGIRRSNKHRRLLSSW